MRIAGAAGVQQSHLLGFLVNALVPWDLFFANRLNRYKASAKATLPVWIHTWYDLEALNALATYSYLHPDNAFPGDRAAGPTHSAGACPGASSAAGRRARAQ